jgi:two-component system sensor histidine kinase KdpD
MEGPYRDPDVLLENVLKEENRLRSGRLFIFLGMCPGVGKTFAMLEEARRLRAEGKELLVGVAETHGRRETEALLEGLPLLPRRLFEHRGAELREFDLDEALRRRPSLLLLDELAHTNAPGSRHPKRWQDAEELLAAGIDVWTTLNIQHVESLRDAVMGITGIRVQETVPDTFLDRAAEIRVIDLTPEQLQARLKAGKVYWGERAAAAAENFFREGNLRALREMALRFAARKVDAEKRDYMRRHLIPGPWRAGERFLVAVGPSPHSERLIRIACRLAQAQNAGWIAAHIHSGHELDAEASGQLAANLALARSLGGEVVSLSSADTVGGILHLARRENVTQIIAGKTLEGAWWQRILHNRIADRLQQDSGPIDVLLVHPGEAAGAPAPVRKPLRTGRFRAVEAWVAAGCVGGVTLLGLAVEGWIGYRSIALFYLLASAVAGLYLSRWVVVGMALAGGLAWNFFFTQPRLTFTIFSGEDTVLLLTSLAVAVIVGHLTARLKERETASRQSEERAQALYRLTRATSASASLAQGVRAALSQVEALFSAKASLLGRSENPSELELLGGHALGSKDESVCLWVLERGQPAGRFTGTLPEASVLATPLFVQGKTLAVLAVQPSDRQLASPVQRDLLDTFATHFCVLLEREAHQKAQREALLLERSRAFQRALLDHVSHEIKTPVAVIQGASDHLLRQDHPGAHNEWLAEIRQAAVRLNRVFNQLVALSRAEAGLIEPRFEICDARDLLEEIAAQFGTDRLRLHGGEFTFRTDPAILQTVLSNLVQNALQHGQGPVDLEASHGDGGARFSIANAGGFIPEQDREMIFERFHRGANSAAGGMGLGLPIARQFASLIGGRLELESSGADKTVFAASFPE